MKTQEIDMAKYAESEEIHEKCIGCAKVFDYTPGEGMITSQKCLTYSRPTRWWNERSITTAPVLVKSKEHPKGILKDLPVVEFRCPVATHLKAKAAAEKAKVNPLKASKRGRS